MQAFSSNRSSTRMLYHSLMKRTKRLLCSAHEVQPHGRMGSFGPFISTCII